MSGLNISKKVRASAVAGLGLLCANIAQADTALTAGVILEKMSAEDRFTYYTGIIHGLAYARFRKDSIANDNQKDQRGMECIENWFFDGGAESALRIDSTLKKYPKYTVVVILSAMVKKRCGE